MLKYDDSAFYYFFLATLSCYLIPASMMAANTLMQAAFCSKDKEAANGSAPVKAKKKKLLTPCFVIHTLVLMALWALFFYFASILSINSEISQFDPYAILELDHGASPVQIKKQYRKLSLKYHPDKNIGDAHAKEMFVSISKAHDALTDDEARSNYEKYGNPDGRQAMQVSIGLPTFLLEKDNHTMILIVYLVVLVVAIPLAVGLWWSYSQQYGQNEVMTGTYQIYMWFFRNESLNVKGMPEVLASSQEFVKLKYTKEDNEVLMKHFKRMTSERIMKKCVRYTAKHAQYDPIAQVFFNNNILLHAHVHQLSVPANAQLQLDAMLAKLPRLIEVMVFMTTVPQQRFWLKHTIQVIQFSQYLTQGLWIKDSDLLQLPHFTSKEAAHCKKGKKGRTNSMRDYIALPAEERKGLANFDEEMKRDVDRVCKQMSDFEIKVTAAVEDEDVIATNDIVTVSIEITRRNVAEGKNAPFVYAPKFPEPKQELLWVLLGDPAGRRMMSMPQKIADQSRVVKAEMKMRAPPKAGQYTFELFVLSDSYVGLDTSEKVTIDVIREEDLPAFEIHPEDLALDETPTLFTQLMEGDFLEDSDSDSDEDADDSLTEAQRKRRRERLARKKGSQEDAGEPEGLSSSEEEEDEDGL